MRQIIKALLLTLCITQTSVAGTEQFLSLVTLDEAVKKIIRQGNRKILATKTESVNGKQVHVIKVLTPDGRIQYIRVDANNTKNIK